MPKILRIINRFNLGGPTYNVAYLTKYLAPEFETLLVGGAKDETEGSSEYIVRSLGIEPVIISEMKREINLLQDRIAYQKIKKIIREYKPDIVHTHASKAGTLGRLAAYNCNVPVIVHTFHGHVFHSYFGKLQTAFYKNIERYLAKKSSAIIAISNKQKNELSNEHHICPAEKIEVIPLGFNLSRFTEAQEEKRKKFRLDYNIANDEVAVGIIGRLVPVKNHKLFVEAIKYINEKSDKKVRAFIVGDGELKEEIIKMAKSTNLTITESKQQIAQIAFTSWIKEVDMVYAGLDIVTLTSFNEGTPVSLIEAQAAGKPIVSTKVGGIEDVVLQEKSALLSPVENKTMFFENLLTLVNSEEKRILMNSGARNHAINNYSYARLVENMKALYCQLLQK